MIQKEIDILNKIKSKGYWEIVIRPIEFEDKKIEREECLQLVKDSKVQRRGINYPLSTHYDQTMFLGEKCAEGIFESRDWYEIWRMYQSGQFVHYLNFIEDWDKSIPWRTGFGKSLENDSSKKVMGTIMTLYTITEIFNFASNLSSHSIFDKGVFISIKLNDTEERILAISDIFRILYKDYVCMTENIIFEKTYAVEELKKNFPDIALKTTIDIFSSFNWISPDIEKALKPDQDKFLKGLL